MYELAIILLLAFFAGAVILKSRAQRYREPGAAVDNRTENEYGLPVKSLFTSRELLSLHHHIDITDEEGNIAYYADSRFLSIRDKTDVYRADGTPVAHIERKPISLHEVHYVEMADGMFFQLSNELLHLVRDVTNIDGLDWVIEGNLLQLNFSLLDSSRGLIAVVGQKAFSIHDKYCVDIYQRDKEEEVVAILVTLQHMISDRAASNASSGGGASSSSG